MITVIKNGFIKEITCPYCKSQLAYNEKEDIKEETVHFRNCVGDSGHYERRKTITCPCCKMTITVSKEEI